MSKLTLLFLAIFVWLQYALWFGKNSIRDYVRVQDDIELQQATNNHLKARNNRLIAEIDDLNNGLDAVEERARNELGMVKSNEHYYRIIPEQSNALNGK
jgi:cell division protein FtsB